jgi:integrase
VLGVTWEDLDLEAATARIRRGAAYTPSVGTVLGSTKTSGAEGIHHLAPISVESLRERRRMQLIEREPLGDAWPTQTYDDVDVSMVFTTTRGGLVIGRA